MCLEYTETPVSGSLSELFFWPALHTNCSSNCYCQKQIEPRLATFLSARSCGSFRDASRESLRFSAPVQATVLGRYGVELVYACVNGLDTNTCQHVVCPMCRQKLRATLASRHKETGHSQAGLSAAVLCSGRSLALTKRHFFSQERACSSSFPNHCRPLSSAQVSQNSRNWDCGCSTRGS